MSLQHYDDVHSKVSVRRYPLAEQYITQPGVHVTGSGLMYRVIELGSGEAPSWDLSALGANIKRKSN